MTEPLAKLSWGFWNLSFTNVLPDPWHHSGVMVVPGGVGHSEPRAWLQAPTSHRGAQVFPMVEMLHYQLKDFGKRALGVVDPLESLVSRFIVGSSASIAKSWLLPLGPLQEKTRAQCPAHSCHQGNKSHQVALVSHSGARAARSSDGEGLEKCLSPSPSVGVAGEQRKGSGLGQVMLCVVRHKPLPHFTGSCCAPSRASS